MILRALLLAATVIDDICAIPTPVKDVFYVPVNGSDAIRIEEDKMFRFNMIKDALRRNDTKKELLKAELDILISLPKYGTYLLRLELESKLTLVDLEERKLEEELRDLRTGR